MYQSNTLGTIRHGFGVNIKHDILAHKLLKKPYFVYILFSLGFQNLLPSNYWVYVTFNSGKSASSIFVMVTAVPLRPKLLRKSSYERADPAVHISVPPQVHTYAQSYKRCHSTGNESLICINNWCSQVFPRNFKTIRRLHNKFLWKQAKSHFSYHITIHIIIIRLMYIDFAETVHSNIY